MNEKYVVSLELAKKMKELGFKQESDFCWCRAYGKIYLENEKDSLEYLPSNLFSAYHVGELGEMLPITIQMNSETHWLEMGKTTFWYHCGYIYQHEGETRGWGRFNDTVHHALGEGKTEADARARMLIYLAENNLLYAKDIK